MKNTHPLILKIAVLSALCFFSLASYADKVSSNISISGVTAFASQPNTTGSIAIMTIKNKDAKAHYITRAYSSIMDSSMLHGYKNGRMKRVMKISLPAKRKIRFSPKGKHIMLIGLKKKLKSGMKFKLTLYFEDASQKTLTVTVK